MHDIGKNLVAMMLEGAGFEVVNVGTGVTPAQFVAAVTRARGHARRHERPARRPPSPRWATPIALLKHEGLRGQVKVIVGGAPVTESFADEIGADAYGANAAAAVDQAKQLTGTGPAA